MPDKTQFVGERIGADMENAARDVAQRARNTAQAMTDAIDDSRSTVADGLDSAASTIHSRGDDLPGGDKVRQFARTTADWLAAGADYLRTHDTGRMGSDIERLVRNNPGPALAVAAACGFLFARAISRD